MTKEPRPTCPLINGIIRDIESLDPSSDGFDRDRRGLIDAMEDLRDANADIRSWGHDMIAEKDSAEAHCLRQIEEFEAVIGDQQDRIEDLEQQIEEYSRFGCLKSIKSTVAQT